MIYFNNLYGKEGIKIKYLSDFCLKGSYRFVTFNCNQVRLFIYFKMSKYVVIFTHGEIKYLKG